MSAFTRESFIRLFSESQGALRRYVRRVVKSQDTTDEILQEAFLRTYEQAERVEAPRSFLFSAARNLALDASRRDRVRKIKSGKGFDPMPGASAGGESLEAAALSEERSKLLKAAVERLSPQCRVAFTLRVFHGYSYSDIAARMNLAPKTVENHIVRALRETHDYLERRYRTK